MFLRRRLRAGGELEHEDRDEIAASLEVYEGAVDPEAGPRRGRDLEQVDAEILDDRHAFVGRPGGVGVEQHLGVGDVRDRLVHGLPRQSGRIRVILSPLSMLAIFGWPVELRVGPGRLRTMVASRSRSAGEAMTRQMLRHWQEAVPNDRLAHLVKHAARGLAQALQMRLTEHSVSYGHWTFLRILWEAEGLTQRQLSDEAGVMEPTTFSALNAMEKLGYVARRPSPTNRKEVHVYLTPKGRALKTKLVPSAEEVNAVALRRVDPGDVAATRRTLLALIANLAADETESLALRRRIPSTRELSRLLSGSRARARKTLPRRRVHAGR